MWLAIALTAIALSGTSFMVWFLIALLRETAPAACYWIVPIRRELTVGTMEARRDEVDEHLHVSDGNGSNYHVELSENESYAKEFASGLVAVHIRAVPASVGWRSIQPNRAVFQQRRFWIS